MSNLPELTVCLTACGRPWYSVLTLGALLNKVHYGGAKKFHIANGVDDNAEEMAHLEEILAGQNYSISRTNNLSAMMNSCAEVGGETWLVVLDDFVPRRFDITSDVSFLVNHEHVGAVRMGRLAFWEHGPDEEVWARLWMQGGQHWWVFDKHRTNHPYISALNACLYHRRYWEAYGNLPDVAPDNPGEAEVELAKQFNANPDGPAVAVPMRFGQNGGADFFEPFWQLPSWRTNRYAATGGGRRM